MVKTQQQRIIELLSPGHWVRLPRILDLRIANYRARISELRQLGWTIDCTVVGVNKGTKRLSWYRMTKNPEKSPRKAKNGL
jgi:hypothetical protein